MQIKLVVVVVKQDFLGGQPVRRIIQVMDIARNRKCLFNLKAANIKIEILHLTKSSLSR